MDAGQQDGRTDGRRRSLSVSLVCAACVAASFSAERRSQIGERAGDRQREREPDAASAKEYQVVRSHRGIVGRTDSLSGCGNKCLKFGLEMSHGETDLPSPSPAFLLVGPNGAHCVRPMGERPPAAAAAAQKTG